MYFKDRADAGKRLAAELTKYDKLKNGIVLGLPRGGVVTAYEVAKALHLPLDIVCPRKVGAPGNPELAIGAVLESGEGYYNEDLISRLGVSPDYIKRAAQEERQVSKRRAGLYRQNLPPLSLKGKTVILVDDGLATGATMKAAIRFVKGLSPESIIAAVPVSPPDTLDEIRKMAEDVVCLDTPYDFMAVGQFYQEFYPVEDDEVIALLSRKGNQ